MPKILFCVSILCIAVFIALIVQASFVLRDEPTSININPPPAEDAAASLSVKISTICHTDENFPAEPTTSSAQAPKGNVADALFVLGVTAKNDITVMAMEVSLDASADSGTAKKGPFHIHCSADDGAQTPNLSCGGNSPVFMFKGNALDSKGINPCASSPQQPVKAGQTVFYGIAVGSDKQKLNVRLGASVIMSVIDKPHKDVVVHKLAISTPQDQQGLYILS